MRNDILQRYRNDPISWIYDFVDKSPRWSKQVETINSVFKEKKTVVKSCHGVGKTFTAKDCALAFTLLNYPCTTVTTAPSWTQVEKLLWAEINNANNNSLRPLGGKCLTTEFKFADNWFIIGVSPKLDTKDGAARMTGFHNKNILIILDEACAIDPRVWEIVETLMTGQNARLLAIGNPVISNGNFSNAFKDDTYKKITMGIFDSPNFTANKISAIEDLIEIAQSENKLEILSSMENPYPALTSVEWAVDRLIKWGKDSQAFRSRVIGEFPKSSNDTCISLNDIEKCFYIEDTEKTVKTLGVDVARFGNDYTCIFGYDDFKQIYKEKYNGQDLVRTASRIKNLIKTQGYKVVVVDDTGLGGGVTDMLRDFIDENSIACNLIPVNFAEKSRLDDFDDIVTEMYWNAKILIETQRVQIVDDGSLVSELSGRKFKYTNTGKFRIEPKSDYKKRTGFSSPDEADAFVLCLYGSTYYSVHGTEFESVGETNFSEDILKHAY